MRKENVEKIILHCKGRRKKDFKVGTKNVATLLVVRKNNISFRKVFPPSYLLPSQWFINNELN